MLYLRSMLLLMPLFSVASCAYNATHNVSETPIDTPPASLEPSTIASIEKMDADLLFDLLVGEFAGNTGDYQLSVKHYLSAAEKTSDKTIAERAARIALYGKHYKDALDAVDRWVELDPDDSDAIRMTAVIWLNLNQPDEAIPYVREFIKSFDNADTLAAHLRRLLQKEADMADGLTVITVISKEYPGNAPMQVLLGRYAAQNKQYDVAEKALNRALELDDTLDEVYMIRARVLLAQGNNKQALASVAVAVENNSDKFGLRLQYARMLIQEKMLPEAREQFELLYKARPENEDILMSLALLSIEIKDNENAEMYLKQLLSIGKKEDTAHFYLGRIDQSRGEHEKAISHYYKVSNGELVFDAKMRIAALTARNGDAEEGIAQLTTLALSTRDWQQRVRVYLAQGEILRENSNDKAALEIYSRALMEKPNDPDLLYARALTAERLDMLDVTESDLRHLISNEPENANALNALGYTLADRTERLQEALELIQKAAALIPDDPAVLDSLGWVSYRLGNMKDALKFLRLAFERLEDAEIAAHLGEVLWKSGLNQQAEIVWEKGKKANADHPVLVDTLRRLEQ